MLHGRWGGPPRTGCRISSQTTRRCVGMRSQVVNGSGKGRSEVRRGRARKANASESLMSCRELRNCHRDQTGPLPSFLMVRAGQLGTPAPRRTTMPGPHARADLRYGSVVVLNAAQHSESHQLAGSRWRLSQLRVRIWNPEDNLRTRANRADRRVRIMRMTISQRGSGLIARSCGFSRSTGRAAMANSQE
jgi:hypothetical protein